MIKRRVFIKLKDGLPAAQHDEVRRRFLRMPAEIPGIVRHCFARNESWDAQFDYIWEVEFLDREALRRYTDHPYHESVRALFPNPHPSRGPIVTEDDGSKPTCLVQRFAMVDYEVAGDR
jgi:hypothetical protein